MARRNVSEQPTENEGVENVHDVIALKARRPRGRNRSKKTVCRALVLYLRGNVDLLLFAGADHEHRQLDLDLPLAVVKGPKRWP